MPSSPLSLVQAVRICEGAVSAAKSRGFAPICVVVLDPGGHHISTQRMDKYVLTNVPSITYRIHAIFLPTSLTWFLFYNCRCAPSAYPKFANAKAFTCVSMGISTRKFRDKYTSAGDPAKYCQMLGMINITEGQMAPFPGGVVIKSKEDGAILGGVGVSGASADEDEYCALAGIQEAGLEDAVTEPVDHALKN